ncbi:hypothetical protein V144x_44870 [Gimesia aquarii]|uniref:CVNH domain protein n=1 Tax=Gimesia aquarii TaxID=2527964 RepID=A0A517W148_9PLAN|nr:hypothetical protein V144x_44870 [Gimesia aquarii]
MKKGLLLMSSVFLVPQLLFSISNTMANNEYSGSKCVSNARCDTSCKPAIHEDDQGVLTCVLVSGGTGPKFFQSCVSANSASFTCVYNEANAQIKCENLNGWDCGTPGPAPNYWCSMEGCSCETGQEDRTGLESDSKSGCTSEGPPEA